MVDIFEYLDYREYLRDRIKEEKDLNPFRSYRFIGQRVQVDSGQLTKIIHGQLHLASKKISNFVQYLKLNPREAEYFETLVYFGKAKSESQIKLYYEKLAAFREVDSKILQSSHYSFYQNWYNAAIYALLDILDFRGNYKMLGKKLVPEISEEQAKESIQLLLDLNMVTVDSDGRYQIQEAHLNTPGKWKSAAIMEYQKSTLELATRALTEVPKEHRNIFTLTMSVDEETIAKIRELTEEFRSAVVKLVDECDNANMVYQFNNQIYPQSTWRKS